MKGGLHMNLEKYQTVFQNCRGALVKRLNWY